MEFDNYLRDGTNTNVFSSGINKDLTKGFKANIENIKCTNKVITNDITGACKENEIMDISMLSISDDSKIIYTLPDSQDLKNKKSHDQWIDDMRTRRWNNRLSACSEMSRLERRLNDISFDSVTGERYLLETLDYRMDLEVSKMPLGHNFLQNTNINSTLRKIAINLLYNTSESLRTDRYVVPMAVACADRYVKEKGKLMPSENYKNVLLSCWFICCKFDLIYYPSIEDICEMNDISNPKTLLNLEADILQTLNFFVSMPTPIEFLRPLTLLKQREGISHIIAKFFLEVSIYVYELACHPSHIIAASSYCFAMALSFRNACIEDTWTDLMKIFTGIDIEDIKPFISSLGYVVITTNFEEDMSAIAREHATVIDVLNKRKLDLKRLSQY